MIINEKAKTTLGGLNMDRISSLSGEVLWMKPKVIFLEYILSTGTLYINTGLISNIDLLFECKFTPVNTGIDSTVFGCFRLMDGLKASELKRFAFGLKAPAVGSKNGTEANSFNEFENNVPYTLEYKNRIFTATSENSTQSFNYSNRTIDFQVECYLFARHDVNLATGTSNTRCPASGKLYYFIAYNTQGEIVKEFRPCSYNGKIGLWELIENKFYPNIGEGKFLGGRELHQVRFVNYIESTGTLYIKTDYKVCTNSKIETKINLSSGNLLYSAIFASGHAHNSTDTMFFLCGSDHKTFYGYAGGATTLPIKLLDGTTVENKDITIKMNVLLFSIKDDTLNYNTKTTGKTQIVNNTRALYIFCGNSDDPNVSVPITKMKLYDFKIWDGLILVRDYRPCIYTEKPWLENAELKVGLWDLVSHKFYDNSGTGEFTAGKNILEFVEFIEATGTQYIHSNYTPSINTSIKAEWEYTNAAERAIYGNSPTANTDLKLKGFRCLGGEGNAFNTTYIASGGMRELHDNTPMPTGKLTTVHKGNTFTYNDTTISSGYGNEFTPLMIAHDGYWDLTNEAVNHRQEWFSGKIYSFLIKDGDVKLRDYRPCVYKDKEGLWDMVYDKFYGNDGTGEFITNLDYTPKFIPYIKSSGTLYIDTDIIPSLDYTVECKAIKEVDCSIFGSGKYGYTYTGTSDSGNYVYIGGSTKQTVSANNSQVHVWMIKERKGWVDGIAKTSASTQTSEPTLNLYLFGRSTSNGINDAGSHTMYYCKIWDGEGNLIRNFRPCIYKKKYGMWDMVEDKFYENKGTGNFIYEGTEWSYDLSAIENNE